MSQRKTGIGLYIHIPFCVQKCHYCDFSSYPGMESLWEDYAKAVVSELAIKSELLRDRIIETIFIGGGTPSLIPYHQISMIMDKIRCFQLASDTEITIECNPGTLDASKLKAYAALGINRLSIGLQAYQERLLKLLGRIHTGKQFEEAVFLAKSHGFSNINADIIFGIPHQTLEDWRETLNRVMALDLPHVSCYGLKIEEGTALDRLRRDGRLDEVDDALDRLMYEEAKAILAEHGLYQYEISNFARQGYASRHNIRYWERDEYVGLGAAAHSLTGDRRYANTSDVGLYLKGIASGKPVLSEDYTISHEEALSESMILGLRMNKGINLDELSRTFGVNVRERFHEKLMNLSSKELVDYTGAMVRLTKKGMDFANQVFIEFI